MSSSLAVDPSQNEALAAFEKKTGPSNFLRVLANRPEAMTALMGYFRTVMGPGANDRRTKELVYLSVSLLNKCLYCSVHHKKGAKAAGVSDAEIAALEAENYAGFTEKEQAALNFARELTRTATVSEAMRARVLESYNNEQLVELDLIVGLANLTNRVNNGLAVLPEA